MHRPVRPIKIGVMSKDHQHNAENEIKVTVLTDVIINPR